MNLVLCNGCGNRFEDSALRRDREQRLVCEECVAQAAAPKKPNAATKVTPPPPPASPSSPERPIYIVETERRVDLLDYIVTHADQNFIQNLVRVRIVESAKWIEILESEPNERVLLRLATELGYGAPAPLSAYTKEGK